MARPWARFDDLRAGTSLLCPSPSRVLVAVRPDEAAEELGVLDSLRDRRPARLVPGQRWGWRTGDSSVVGGS